MTATQVLVLGLDPRSVPGYDPEPVVAAIERGRRRFDELGISCRFELLPYDEDPEAQRRRLAEVLGREPYPCVVIGGGIRGDEERPEALEVVVNLVRRHAPQAAIAFNSRPDDTADAALRRLDRPNDHDAFLTEVLDRHVVAIDAFHSGDTGPWRTLWAAAEPVTLYPPGRPPALGRDEVVTTFERAASRLSRGSDGRFEVHHVEVSGDLAVLTGLERSVFSAGRGPVAPQTLRVTLVYRREKGAWRMVHRHADGSPD